MSTDSATTTAQRALLHEALYPRLAALAAEAQSVARRRPEAPVPAAIAILAESLLFDAGPFLGRGKRALVPSPPDFGGLAARLGQALAGLDAFEARHAPWSPKLNCFAWHLPRDRYQPVRRLRPVGVPLEDREARKASQKMRDELTRRILIRYDEAEADGFKAGFAAGKAEAETGVPSPRPPGYPRLRAMLGKSPGSGQAGGGA